MLSMSIADMLEATGATLLCGDPERVVTGVTTDSRSVEDGSVFVCFAGERVNGNRFAAQAVEAGAGAVVLTEDAPDGLADLADAHGCALLRAASVEEKTPDDTDPSATEFLLRLAAAWRERNDQWVVVGVTGSVGKTTTKDMLACGLATQFATHATKGNFNNLIGLPLTLLAASPDDEVVVAEMGMNHAGELARLTKVARPTVALVTNVGTSHIGFLGSREAIACAKAEIVRGMTASDAATGSVRPCLVLTEDNDFGTLIDERFCQPAGVEVVRVGTSAASDVRAEGITLDEQGLPSFELAFGDGWHERVALDTPGRHVVSDFLIAMAIADRLGADRSAVAQAIAHMPQTHMRLEVLTAPGRPRVIDDSYNASPNSIAAALDVLCSMECDGRRVAVLGQVGELGSEAERLHGYIGAYAAAKPLDLLVFVGGEDAGHMAEAARTMGFSEDRLEVLPTAQRALEVIGPVLAEGDLVLAKGSRSVGLDVFAKGVLA
ncbi:MAG: UDP-N-acetylmuramoyl-tripeptide--D-alanyl-D-alanine ligase [Atopobiaceae bacterium]|nr:UDP-N-acetylmuramoyl-tripeptide--D-alanyl-D-alanine ligase [Atopobiaceae bacterium]